VRAARPAHAGGEAHVSNVFGRAGDGCASGAHNASETAGGKSRAGKGPVPVFAEVRPPHPGRRAGHEAGGGRVLDDISLDAPLLCTELACELGVVLSLCGRPTRLRYCEIRGVGCSKGALELHGGRPAAFHYARRVPEEDPQARKVS